MGFGGCKVKIEESKNVQVFGLGVWEESGVVYVEKERKERE